MPEKEELNDCGLYGLAIMGQNFALNMASHGFTVSICNRSENKIDTTIQIAKENHLPIVGIHDPKNFVLSIQKPRRIFILVQAGAAVDETIDKLSPYMDSGDVLIDCGNEWFLNTIRRGEKLDKIGIHFIGMGMSGGEEGARLGPSLMPGGSKIGYDIIEPILSKCAAQVGEESSPCTTYVGPLGSGNYVKMVHNGIEYGDMQLIAEIYDILKQLGGCTNDEMSEIFAQWNTTELDSFLIEITSIIMNKKDDLTEGYILEMILDKTGMKGTGKWCIQEAAENAIAASTISAALDSRYISGLKEERVFASSILKAPSEIPNVERSQIIEDCKNALYAAKICSYAQGLCLIQSASKQHDWNINLSEILRIWRSGCIIRASLLDRLFNAYKINPGLSNLMVDPSIAGDLNRNSNSWRRIVTLCFASGIACPALSSSLCYLDSYRRDRLPANLTQAQRDFFGGHTYERIDRSGLFHTKWTSSHKDIDDLKGRKKGEI